MLLFAADAFRHYINERLYHDDVFAAAYFSLLLFAAAAVTLFTIFAKHTPLIHMLDCRQYSHRRATLLPRLMLL